MSAEVIERYEDMSVTGRLRLIKQEDGDIIVATVDGNGNSTSVEFCTYAGGGKSFRTRQKLLELFEVMQEENEHTPQYR